ncbi:MAG: hypothetical protein GWP41_00900 [Planctomycetia bacterium]|jgi:hypothetical protein|nr:hypothetical protein [Planctomycetia bacterium]NCF98641.1 hypothetical protein [Planctomycetia bacterium]NCG12895.1 hypothetical protein [Planctomycetia bacterium]
MISTLNLCLLLATLTPGPISDLPVTLLVHPGLTSIAFSQFVEELESSETDRFYESDSFQIPAKMTVIGNENSAKWDGLVLGLGRQIILQHLREDPDFGSESYRNSLQAMVLSDSLESKLDSGLRDPLLDAPCWVQETWKPQDTVELDSTVRSRSFLSLWADDPIQPTGIDSSDSVIWGLGATIEFQQLDSQADSCWSLRMTANLDNQGDKGVLFQICWH